MTEKKCDDVARALVDVFTSPNEADQNLEVANVVDGLFAIARALDTVAVELRDLKSGIANDVAGGQIAADMLKGM